jgi:hypothetical protein
MDKRKRTDRMIELSRQRSAVYGLPARMYRRDTNTGLPPRVQDPQNLGVLRGPLGAHA